MKPLYWIGASRKDLKSFPQPVQRDIGYALFSAQNGETDPAGIATPKAEIELIRQRLLAAERHYREGRAK